MNGLWAPRSPRGRRCRQLKQALLEPIDKLLLLATPPLADPLCISTGVLELAMRRAAACGIRSDSALMRRARQQLEHAHAVQELQLGWKERPSTCASLAQTQVLLGEPGLMQAIGGFLRRLERHRLMRVCKHWQANLPPPGRTVIEALGRVLSGERLCVSIATRPV